MSDSGGIRGRLKPTTDSESQMLYELAMVHFGAAVGLGVGGPIPIGWPWVTGVAGFAAATALSLWAGERP
jgi:hypothetical protein